MQASSIKLNVADQNLSSEPAIEVYRWKKAVAYSALPARSLIYLLFPPSKTTIQ